MSHSPSSSWLPWPPVMNKMLTDGDARAQRKRDEEALHRKRLSSILRYIASMHQVWRSADGTTSHSFVRSIRDSSNASDFFQYERGDDEFLQEDSFCVLFSTNDFRRLLAAEALDGGSSTLWSSPPFSFYACPSSTAPASTATFQSSSSCLGRQIAIPSFNGHNITSTSSASPTRVTDSYGPKRGQGLWLRLTRLGHNAVAEQPGISPIVDKYLKGWLKESAPRGCSTISDLLTIHHLERAPGIPSTVYSIRHQRLIKTFLKQYKQYLKMRLYQQTLEPIYNRLFEWIQQQNENNEELVWGLGHAKFLSPDGQLINGPLLEVLVEVELAPDGGLLVKPRQHTGVSLNREVVSALAAADPLAQHSVLSQLHRTVGELESNQLSPGQPSTYVTLLKRIAMEISPGGAFLSSSTNLPPSLTTSKKRTHSHAPSSKLIVTEAWCLYSRSKPSSVWARDANTFADHVALPESIEDELPIATWSLTHGPSKLEDVLQQGHLQRRGSGSREGSLSGFQGIANWFSSNFIGHESSETLAEEDSKSNEKLVIVPLASSVSQQRIADLLLRQNYPVVLAEGPPGTGKSHTICNIVSAYLCQGKRVLVTSKNANALNVLRGRMPKSIQELCVDVTMSELQGMRQLQQTVERLANRISTASSDVEIGKYHLLRRSIHDLETQLEGIDRNFTEQSEKLRVLLQKPDGAKLVDKSSFLICTAPWLMKTLPEWNLGDLEQFSNRLRALQLDKSNAIRNVDGFQAPPSRALVSLALAKSGSTLSSFANATRTAVASLPIVGAMMNSKIQRLNEEIDDIRVNERKPVSEVEWKTVADALQYSIAVHDFQETCWLPMVKDRGWPLLLFEDQEVVNEVADLLEAAVEVKRLHAVLDVSAEIDATSKSREMGAYRARLVKQIQHHSEELVDAAVVAELSKSFSPDAQSALIRFSQIAGAAKFNKSAKPSKMTQRQRRRRQEYLEAFSRCVRQIPCWIMTSSQISQYLPAETLFDLVVIDESSQSDITVLPGMMRGKQWLIVGDGKQVSPTEAFVSDDDIDSLKAALPAYCPFADALLPGRSFFDLCAQAFPRGRVVLSEHFRCAPEIIRFSNTQFYDGRLVPLRLPTKRERLKPSLIDVMLPNGVKTGKVNEQEADQIVDMVREAMALSDEGEGSPRSIGIISLMGDDQSRLIRGRLLDAVGPEKMARHELLIGDPPSFQGAERDIIFLSMVCSRGSTPTQNQQFHFQRANVAMSRARDRCVLVRSIDLRDIPSLDDSKIAIIEFFMQASVSFEDTASILTRQTEKKHNGASLLKHLLDELGYELVDMGVIWKNAICVEHKDSDTRAAIMVDCEEPSCHEWAIGFNQQKAIERVGWKCLRIDALSLVFHYSLVVESIVKFLTSVGIPNPELTCHAEISLTKKMMVVDKMEVEKEKAIADQVNPEIIEVEDESVADVISSEGDDRKHATLRGPGILPDNTKSGFYFGQDENIEASRFGEVVDLSFLLRRKDGDEYSESDDDSIADDDDGCFVGDRRRIAVKEAKAISTRKSPHRVKKVIPSNSESPKSLDLRTSVASKKRCAPINGNPGTQEFSRDAESKSSNEEVKINGETNISGNENKELLQRRKRRRLDKYARDGRWYSGSSAKGADHDGEWYDTDSDLPKEKSRRGNDDESWQDDDDQSSSEVVGKNVGEKFEEVHGQDNEDGIDMDSPERPTPRD